jgi:hypothetical protein
MSPIAINRQSRRPAARIRIPQQTVLGVLKNSDAQIKCLLAQALTWRLLRPNGT